VQKWPALLKAHPGLELHLIGPLQSNKAREAVGLFDAIHSIDPTERMHRGRQGDRAAGLVT